ncbi:MAG: hypothetical protein ACREQI_05210 [Candidatus Binataceae bacterium]
MNETVERELNEVERAAADAIARIEGDPLITPLKRTAAAIRRMAEIAYPDARIAEAREMIEVFAATAIALLRSADDRALNAEIEKLDRAAFAVQTPPPAPTPGSELARAQGDLAAIGWNALEIEFLGAWINPGEKLLHFDARGACLGQPAAGESDAVSQRRITRRELRDRNRPPHWRDPRKWETQFSPIPAEGESLTHRAEPIGLTE